MIKSLPLRTKMILAFSLVAIISIASIVIYASLDSTRQAQNYVARGGMYGLNSLVARLESYYGSEGTWKGVDHAIAMGQMMTERGIIRSRNNHVALLDSDREVIWSSIENHRVGDQLQEQAVKNALELKDAAGKIVGFLVVENASNISVSDISPFIARLRGLIVIAGIIAAIVAVGMAIVLSNQLLRPVKALTDASAKLSAGNLATRVNVEGEDELAELGKTFNQMAANLESDENRKKALTADIAHELRTPLAVQKAQIEAMIDGVIPLDKENLLTVSNQADFLSRMVDDLRLLAMADSGELKLEIQTIKIEELVKRVVDQFKVQVQKNGIELMITDGEMKPSGQISTDPIRVEQIVSNLIDNALRYGKKGGKIEVIVENKTDSVVISVRDDGNGIPTEALPHLFERFYRHEKARDRETGGSGLGLAISKKLANLLGGDLTAANHTQGGGVFTLSLPYREI